MKNEFKCSGFKKIMATLIPGSFKKQSYKYMLMFKEFTENEPGPEEDSID